MPKMSAPRATSKWARGFGHIFQKILANFCHKRGLFIAMSRAISEPSPAELKPSQTQPKAKQIQTKPEPSHTYPSQTSTKQNQAVPSPS